MHPRTIELQRHIDDCRATLTAAFDAVPGALRERRPGAGRWSVAGVLEHLAIVERQVAALLGRSLRAAIATGGLPPDPDTSPVLPSIDATRLLDRERRINAPPTAAPKGVPAAEAWRALEESRRSLRDVLLLGDGLATAVIRAPHPALGELNFHQWFAFLGFHEARHAAQIRATTRELADLDSRG